MNPRPIGGTHHRKLKLAGVPLTGIRKGGSLTSLQGPTPRTSTRGYTDTLAVFRYPMQDPY